MRSIFVTHQGLEQLAVFLKEIDKFALSIT